MTTVETPPAARTVDVEGLYREHLASIIRLLRRGFRYGPDHRFARVDSAVDLEEIAQETFTRFMAQCDRGSYDPERPAGPYLRRIAINVALHKMGVSWKEEPVESFDDEVATEASSLDHVVSAETKQLVEEFKTTLSEEERVVLQRCIVDGASQAEAGDEFEVSRDKVYRTLQKIRRSALSFFKKKGWPHDA